MALQPNYAPQGTYEYDVPYYDGAAIVVATPFPPCRAIWVGVAGNVTATLVGGNSVQFLAAPVGILAIGATNISAATATNMVALY